MLWNPLASRPTSVPQVPDRTGQGLNKMQRLLDAWQVARGGCGADSDGGAQGSPRHPAAAAPAPVVVHRPCLPQDHSPSAPLAPGSSRMPCLWAHLHQALHLPLLFSGRLRERKPGSSAAAGFTCHQVWALPTILAICMANLTTCPIVRQLQKHVRHSQPVTQVLVCRSCCLTSPGTSQLLWWEPATAPQRSLDEEALQLFGAASHGGFPHHMLHRIHAQRRC